ncbi:peroxiredoxin [Candidatus Fermentibacteria bacterium]|nr:MAG: peroxiredoxin [Candidatus Fermentibacteria bacterium]
MASVTFKATSRKLPGGLAVENESRGFKLTMDEPAELGGTDTGMNPVEALLCALGSCQCIVGAAFAKAKNISFTELWVETEGDLNPDGFIKGLPDVRRGFEEIRFKLHIKTDNDEEQIYDFAEFMQERCPVEDNLQNSTPVKALPVEIVR